MSINSANISNYTYSTVHVRSTGHTFVSQVNNLHLEIIIFALHCTSLTENIYLVLRYKINNCL